MRRQFNNIISVVYSAIRFIILKAINPKGISVKMIERISPNVVIEVNRSGKLRLGKKVRVHSGCKFKIRQGAEMCIDANVKINYNCILVCHKYIHIGENTELGPNVLIYDHDHDYRVGLNQGKFKTSPVIIGKNCWIGANSVILRGTILGDNCIVGAGSVIKGKYPANTVIIQKRITNICNVQC